VREAVMSTLLHHFMTHCYRNIVWVPWYAHLLAPYFDYFMCDGTHDLSKHGWRFIPLCIVSSGGSLLPIGAVFGLEESTDALELLHAAIWRHCHAHGVDCSAFAPKSQSTCEPCPPPNSETAAADSAAADCADKHDWAKVHLRNYLYPVEWESFVVSLFRDNADDATLMNLIPLSGPGYPVLHTDGGPAFPALWY
jgi:hypothetical protein